MNMKDHIINIYMPNDLRRKLKLYCQEQKVNMSEYVRSKIDWDEVERVIAALLPKEEKTEETNTNAVSD